jgi:hypothetical protein
MKNLVIIDAEEAFNTPLTPQQEATLREIKLRQDAGDDTDIDYTEIPELTEDQLASATRPNRR